VSLYPGTWAAESIKQGLSANEGLRQFRAQGGSVGRSAWLALRAEAGVALSRRPDEMSANLNAIPTNTDPLRFQNGTKTGFIQQVEILIRSKGTDVITNRPFAVRTDTLMTRAEAIAYALNVMEQNAGSDRYANQVALGGVYTGTYELTPGMPQ
jgi:hypothetical protein